MRSFIAVNFPSEVRNDLWEAATPLRAAAYPVRWVRPSGLHLTLKFLGDVDPDRTESIQAGLGDALVDTNPFEVTISGFGAYPSVRRPRVVWAGVDSSPPLELAFHAVEGAMATLGFEPEGRIFRPHITLGRVQRDADHRRFSGLAHDLAKAEFMHTGLVDQIELMESKLGRDGATYSVSSSAVLTGRS